MSRRDYPRLDIYAFGRALLESGDLDPLYIALHKAEMKEDRLQRWLVAYWCFYSAGVASYLSSFQDDGFWDQMKMAAENDRPAPHGGRWERGHERRHFRGAAAVKAVSELRVRYYKPEQLVQDIVGNGLGLTMASVSAKAQELPLFGPWIGFKVADMIDRVLGVPVSFKAEEVYMFDSPREAALMVWRTLKQLPSTAKPRDGLESSIILGVADHLVEKFAGYQAPPLYDRAVNIQEIETILCKWKSSLNGHYPPFNDIREINAGLDLWVEKSKTAKLVRGCMPQDPGRETW